jgi:hypothetical protein
LTQIKKRLTVLLLHHECRERRIPIDKLKSKRKRKELQEGIGWTNELTQVTSLSPTQGADFLSASYAWLDFTKAWGLGGLVIPVTNKTIYT